MTNQLGANQVECNNGILELGIGVFYLSVAATPLQRLTNWAALVNDTACKACTDFSAALHCMDFLWFNHASDGAEMWKDRLKNPFIIIGLIVGSGEYQCSKQKLLAKYWQTLHRLAYRIGSRGIFQFGSMKAGRRNVEPPLIVGAVVATMLVMGVVAPMNGRSRKHSTPVVAAS